MKLSTRSRILILIGFVLVSLILYSKRNSTRCNVDSKLQKPISDDQEFITDCITKKIIGRFPLNLEVLPFTDQLNLASETAEQRLASFQTVFNEKSWVLKRGDPNVVSGSGSTLVYSQEAMAALHTIISDIKRKFGLSRVRLLDIPCGDMTWMSRFLLTRDDIDYTGYDIVPELISKHQNTFKDRPWKFFQHDVVEKPINGSFDLIFSRMMLQHLMTKDVLRILKRVSDSGSKYLLTTTFPKVAENVELNTKSKVRFRYLNLEMPPISLILPICLSRDGTAGAPLGGDSHFLGLWKLPLRMVGTCSRNTAINFTSKSYNNMHSCSNWFLPN